ncbi:hypothetical protein [Maricaulis maris]|jgi:hypothetical protein|uniref:hypothetical protein n=1 Tax=Maricaulis maris TaxID=74318 RepID=UPI0029223210|nr:hypothetical protein MACH15_27920 [Maricaulis maris]
MTVHDRNQYILSLGAVAMSAIALLFAFLELRSSDRQLDTSVWPYVDTSFSLNANSASLTLANKGLGPALIHEFRVLHNGVEIRHPLELPQFADGRGGNYSVTTASAPGSVLAVGEELTSFEIRGENVGLGMEAALRDIQIELCYCSINGACWSNHSQANFREPVAACADQDVDIGDALDIFRETNSDVSPQAEDTP